MSVDSALILLQVIMEISARRDKKNKTLAHVQNRKCDQSNFSRVRSMEGNSEIYFYIATLACVRQQVSPAVYNFYLL